MKNIIALIALLICSAAQAQDVKTVSAWAIDPPLSDSDTGQPAIATATIDNARAVSQAIVTGTAEKPIWQLSSYVRSVDDAHASTEGDVEEDVNTNNELWYKASWFFTAPDDPTLYMYSAEIRLGTDNQLRAEWIPELGHYEITGDYIDQWGIFHESVSIVLHSFQGLSLIMNQQGVDGTIWMTQDCLFKSDAYDTAASTVRLAKLQDFVPPPPPPEE